MKHIIVIAAAMLMAGCATSPMLPEDAAQVPQDRVFSNTEKTADQNAAVQITRDSGFTGSACTARVQIDGKKVAALNAGETTGVWVAPGYHVVGVSADVGICGGGTHQTQVHTSADDVTYLRVSFASSGAINIEPSAYK